MKGAQNGLQARLECQTYCLLVSESFGLEIKWEI